MKVKWTPVGMTYKLYYHVLFLSVYQIVCSSQWGREMYNLIVKNTMSDHIQSYIMILKKNYT